MPKLKTFVTFGQIHVHSIEGKTFDKDCVAVIHHNEPFEGRQIAESYFGVKFCFEYPEEHWDESSMSYYPRGYINLN